MRMNPYRYNAPPHWNPIDTAPRDGTLIEIQNNWGVAPHFGVCKWVDEYGRGGWQYANDPCKGMGEGPHLSWRPFKGDVAQYADPTGGAQNTRAYWLEACGYNPRDFPGSGLSFEQEAERDLVAKKQACPTPEPQQRKGILRRLLESIGV